MACPRELFGASTNSPRRTVKIEIYPLITVKSTAYFFPGAVYVILIFHKPMKDLYSNSSIFLMVHHLPPDPPDPPAHSSGCDCTPCMIALDELYN